MVRLIAALVRHGRHRDPPGAVRAHVECALTWQGYEEACVLSDGLVARADRYNLALHPVIDCSRMLCSWQTASIAAKDLSSKTGADFSVRESDALSERSFGAAANLTTEEIEAALAVDPRYQPLPSHWQTQSDFRLPFQGAESLLDAGRRAAQHIDGVLAELATEVAANTMKVFIGHSAAFRYAAVALGILDVDAAANASIGHCRAVLLERLEGGRWAQVGGDWGQIDPRNGDVAGRRGEAAVATARGTS